MTPERLSVRQEALRLMGQEQWEQARSLLSGLATTTPEDYSLQWNLGWCLIKLERPSEAVIPLTHAVSLHPDKPHGHWALGVAYSDAGASEKAEAALKTSLSLKDSSIARLSLAMLYYKGGRLADAEEVHRGGVRLRPDLRERVEALADFLDDVGRRPEALSLREKALAMMPRVRPPRP